jgi:hypothetical protein
MKLKPKITIADHFAQMSDPRVERSRRHKLIDIITIAICAVICGADTWVDIESYGRAKERMVKTVFRIAKWHPKS